MAYRFPADLRYGTIAVIGEDEAVPARCLLVDPPPDPDLSAPRRVRLLQRMRFLRDWISFVSPRLQLASAISTRVAALERLSDPFELENVPLRRGNNTVLEFAPVDFVGHTTFFYNKARVSDGPAGGAVTRYGRDLLLLGFREDFVQIAAAQDFERLLAYQTRVGSLQKTVDVQLSAGRFRQLELPAELSRPSPKGQIEEGITGPLQISLTGELHYTAEGLVFGVLPVPLGK